MAVSKIRKISSTSLLIIAILTIIVTIAFFVGGYIDPTAAKPEPKFTDALFYLMYISVGITLLAMIVFAIVGFANNLKNPKKRRASLAGLGTFVAIIVVLAITYAIGGTEHMPLSVDFQKYNTDFYLKFTDMWLYSIYLILGLNLVALLVFAIKGSFKSRK